MYSSCGRPHACMVILIVISFCWNSSVASWFLINFHCILYVISLDIKIKWRNYNELVQFISFWFFVTSSSKLQCWTTENCGLCCIGNKIRFLYKKVSDSSSLTPFFWSLLKLPEVAKNWHFALQRNNFHCIEIDLHLFPYLAWFHGVTVSLIFPSHILVLQHSSPFPLCCFGKKPPIYYEL